ncbi:MAG TPA: ABC transporter ATP-binding protein [Pirellulaceae bacterium]|nr:ABC transporter ATP-binding protein [Pirellulaceae bacterium]
MSDAAIAVEKLSKTYVEGLIFRKRRQALKDLTLEVRRGEIFGLLGANGAGKTTFIKILLGIIRKSGGRATLLDFPAGDRRGRKLVGYLPENLRVPRHLTGLTALEYYGQLSGVPMREIRAKRMPLLEMVGIAPRAKDSVRTYSKGMLQRLGLAQAMLHDPQLLVMDEPTDGLDPLARSQVRGYLVELKRQGKTIFLNSHILQEVQLVCDRVAILDKGELRRVGSVAELTTDPALAGRVGVNGDQLELHLELTGDANLARAALNFFRVVQFHSVEPARHLLVLYVQSQEDVDRLVDQVRRANLSIVNLSRRRATLEDAFLEIVQAAAAPD